MRRPFLVFLGLPQLALSIDRVPATVTVAQTTVAHGGQWVYIVSEGGPRYDVAVKADHGTYELEVQQI